MKLVTSAEVPDNLSAHQYYELGLQYRLAGWVGLARDALCRAKEMSVTGPIANKAEKVLRTQLPRLPVPQQAEQRNIEAYNLMDEDPQRAKAIFEELMSHYPDFEWPFSNVAWMKMKDGDIQGARSLARYLLSVNPDHLRSLHLMVHVALAERNFAEALKYMDRVLELYPNDEEFKQLRVAIKIETQGPPPDVVPSGLSAQEYFNLGIEYTLVGRFELARESCKKASELDSAAVGVRADKFVRTQLPRQSLSSETERAFMEANELMRTDQEKAKTLLVDLTKEYPEFELPFLTLATLELMQGDAKLAEELIRHVVTSSPDFINAKLLLVNLYISENRFDEALQFVDRSLATLEDEDSDNELSLDLLKAHCKLYGHLPTALQE